MAHETQAPEAHREHTNDTSDAREGFIERFSKKIIAVLATLTAAMTLATAGLGVANARTGEQKDRAEARGDELAVEVSVLSEQLVELESQRDTRQAEIATLEAQRDELEQTVRELRDGEGPAATDSLGNDPADTGPATTDVTYLSDLDILNGSYFDDDSGQIGGAVYVNSVRARQGWCPSDARVTHAEYDLGRRYRELTATIGLSDTNHTYNRTVRYVVLVDNDMVFEQDITAGEAAQIAVSVEGGLRMRLEVIFYRPEDCSSSQYDRALWGDAALSP